MLTYMSFITCIVVTLLVSLYLVIYYAYQLVTKQLTWDNPRIATIAAGVVGVISGYEMLTILMVTRYEEMRSATAFLSNVLPAL